MEFVFVIAFMTIIFGFVTRLVKMNLDYKKAQLNGGSDVSPDGVDRSLTVSELQKMIESAVQDATAPLERRLLRVEQRLVEAGTHELSTAQIAHALPAPVEREDEV